MTAMTASNLISRWSSAIWSGALGVCAIVAIIRPVHADPRAVVELFTSQGCSSCPPADKIIGELSSDPSIIALSMPIDYWDYLGWKDTLADSRFTARQRAYSRMRGDREVYTPQVVVNGAEHVIGSDRAGIENAIAKTSSSHNVMSVPVSMKRKSNTPIGGACGPTAMPIRIRNGTLESRSFAASDTAIPISANARPNSSTRCSIA